MTFSLLALSDSEGAVGIAIQSKFPGVASIAIHGREGVAVMATQGFSNPDHPEKGLELLRLGVSPSHVLDTLLAEDADRGSRQIAILTADNRKASFEGADVKSWPGHSGCATSDNAIAIGNSLVSERVLEEMLRGFETTAGDLATRLINGIAAGQAAGGEYRGVQAAGVLVFAEGKGFQGHGGKVVDISVYDHADPIGELARCYELHKLSHLPSDPKDLIEISPDIANELRAMLRGRGYLSEPSSSGWGEPEIAAMALFMGVENYDNRIRQDDLIDRVVLEDIRAKQRRV